MRGLSTDTRPGRAPAPAVTVAAVHRPARTLHPLAWWTWALGAAVAVSRLHNPLGLLLVGAAVITVADRRCRPGAGGRAVGVFVRLGLVVVAIRVAMTLVVGAAVPGTVVLHVPEVGLPDWLEGVHIGGPVTLEMLLGAVYEGLRLGLLLVCFGAANAMASPYRLVRSLPPVLHEAGVAVAVGVGLAPQLVVSATRVRAARRLRGRPGGVRGVRGTIMPVLEGALERAVATAASMDSRGYGRREAVPPGRRRLAGAALLCGVVALAVGTYGVLDGSAPPALATAAVLCGAVALFAGLAVAGARTRRTVHDPQPWRGAEWLVALGGLGAAAVVTWAATPAELAPVTSPARWPALGVASIVAAALVASAGWTSPPVRAAVHIGGAP